jgi:trans-aconitate 2-methyltransferase
MTWDPNQYHRFADERGRPFHELVDRIDIDSHVPKRVLDLGCGPGNLTATLCDRWPQAFVLGVDNDAAMLSSAAELVTKRLRFEFGDIATWRIDSKVEPASEPFDVIVSNAAYQWVPGHLALLPELLNMLASGGWFALQVPGNLDDPHHQAIRALVREQPFASIATVKALPERTHSSHTALEYLDVLSPLCSQVDAWETSYVHILKGEDPVLEWIKGTALRPVLAALGSAELQSEFTRILAPRLRALFPSKPWGTPFPFRRVFVVARRP